MGLRLFSLVAYLVSAAYLAGWLLRQAWLLAQNGRALWFQRRVAGKVLALKSYDGAKVRGSRLINLAGAIGGGVVTLWLIQVMVKEWLLVMWVVLAILAEELRVSMQAARRLAAMVLFDRLASQQDRHNDLFETLASVIQVLPAGEVQTGVREAVLLRRGGDDTDNSLKPLHGLDPLLDEYLLSLRLTGWQNGPAENLVLQRLLKRAGRSWDRASRGLYINDRCQGMVQFGRGATIAGIGIALVSSFPALSPVLPERALLLWAGLAMLGAGLAFCLILSNPWLRRFLAASILILAFSAYANALVIPMPAWIRVETISHPARVGNPTLTPVPIVLPAVAGVPSVKLSTLPAQEVSDRCCQPTYQSRE